MLGAVLSLAIAQLMLSARAVAGGGAAAPLQALATGFAVALVAMG